MAITYLGRCSITLRNFIGGVGLPLAAIRSRATKRLVGRAYLFYYDSAPNRSRQLEFVDLLIFFLKNLTMIALEPGETIQFEAHKHWFIIAVDAVSFFVLGLLPLVLEPLMANYLTVDVPLVFFYLLWLLGLTVSFFFAWTDYYFDVWYVTNKRVIDVEQKGVFNRDEATVVLQNIQDITIDTRGLIPTLLHFGDVRLQTAGESREFLLRSAANPDSIRTRLQALELAAVGGKTSS